MPTDSKFDVIIIGGSYAGLSAAMTLGRAIRHVLVIDGGKPCNRTAPQAHNFITHDGKKPGDISSEAREQVLSYPTISFLDDVVTGTVKNESSFDVRTESGKTFNARKLLFATGINDLMPQYPGFKECWGVSILHCPYCHGYEVRHTRTGTIGNGHIAFEFARHLSNWTKELVVLTNGPSTFTKDEYDKLTGHNIVIIEKEIDHVKHANGQLEEIIFKDQSSERLKALYAKPDFKQHCDLPQELRCELNQHGLLTVDNFQRTTMPGVYAAGDNCSMGRSIAVAVSAGNVAGIFLNNELIEEDF
jgi:thioredoxin reductase